MATSDHVAKTLSGDCTEYAMLAAAMCKAQGIPARTALGLIYVCDGEHTATLAFHMWTEVYVRGQWLGLDATLGRGSVGPDHIKITDHSWYQVEDFKPLLPVTGFLLAKPAIEVKAATRE
jgi:transglutaminase-like putative cysteine protease